MAMNKTEQAAFEKLRNDLALARAMRWPSYPKPAPMSRAEIEANLIDGGERWGSSQKVARGWYQNAYSKRVTYGCSTVVSHNIEGDTTSSQNMGVMYAIKADALRAMRLEMTEKFARDLAGVDRQIEEAESE
ncbi:MAG: hypothetical protein EOS79_11465 [Mesorhizobium sp.]|nr:MAG: hypothetical protein EOS79_11465 [Mesorhizobium sp.]